MTAACIPRLAGAAASSGSPPIDSIAFQHFGVLSAPLHIKAIRRVGAALPVGGAVLTRPETGMRGSLSY